MKNILYHYCSVETFMSIMKNKTIRASDCSKTNDSTESSWIATLIEEVLIQLITDDQELCNALNIDEAKINYARSCINTVIQSVYYKNCRDMVTFITCFSEDGDLLSQWRGYANNGQGVSIGFKKLKLLSFDTNAYNYSFKKIIYSPLQQKKHIEKSLCNLINSYKQIKSNDDQDYYDFIQDISLTIATTRNFSPRFKNEGFKEEKEWRLIINNHLANYLYSHDNDPITTGNIDENYLKKAELSNGFIRESINFRTISDAIVPFFDINFNNIKDELIYEIVIGPRCSITELDMKIFLRANGFDYSKIHIYKSKTTYR